MRLSWTQVIILCLPFNYRIKAHQHLLQKWTDLEYFATRSVIEKLIWISWSEFSHANIMPDIPSSLSLQLDHFSG